VLKEDPKNELAVRHEGSYPLIHTLILQKSFMNAMDEEYGGPVRCDIRKSIERFMVAPTVYPLTPDSIPKLLTYRVIDIGYWLQNDKEYRISRCPLNANAAQVLMGKYNVSLPFDLWAWNSTYSSNDIIEN
jgi:hypothetical protein